MEYQPINNNVPEYWEGPKNILVRLYAYLQIGFAETNNAKVVVAGIWGLYLLLNIHQAWWVAVMAAVIVPVLVFVGRFKLYKVAKPQEYTMTTKGSVLGYSAYNLQVRTVELLEEIAKHLNQPSNP